MARWLASPLPHHGTYRYVHNALTVTFAVTCIAAVVAIMSALCSSCHKKPKRKPSHDAPCSNKSSAENPVHNSEFEAATAQILELQGNVNKNDSLAPPKEETKVVELTLDVATHGPIQPAVQAVQPATTSKSSSIRRLSISLSKKLPDIMRASRKEKKDHAEPGEDMIWKKQIILGEKCRVPSDDEEEGGVKSYHPKTPRSRPMSRASSFAYHDASARTSSVAQNDLSLERTD